MRALEGVFAEREVSLLTELVEKSSSRDNFREAAQEAEEDFDGAGARSEDDGARTVVPHQLECVEEEDNDQIARREQQWEQQEEQEDQEERRRRRAELGRPRTPEPMGLGMMHLPLEDDEDPRRVSSPLGSQSVIDQLFERLITSISNQLESAVELSSSLRAQHTAAQSTISPLESKVTALEGLVRSSQAPSQQSSPVESTSPALPESTSSPARSPSSESDSLTQILNEWKQSVEGQWSSVREE